MIYEIHRCFVVDHVGYELLHQLSADSELTLNITNLELPKAMGAWSMGNWGSCPPSHWEPLSREKFLNFQVKTASFYAFLLHKNTCGQEPEPASIDP